MTDFNITIDRDSEEPLYQQIKKEIKANVERGFWPPDTQLPTYKVLAKETGVSMITIQQSVGALVKEGVLYRKRGIGVFTAAPKDQAAASQTIGLLLPDIRHPFFSSLAHAIQAYAAQDSYTTMMFSLNTPQLDAHHAIGLLLNQDISGIITSPAIIEKYAFQFSKMLDSGLPVTFIDGRSPLPQFDYVAADNRLGLELIIKHLTELGHTRIGFACCQIITQSVEERISLFQEILAKHRLPFEPALLQVSHLANDEGGEDAGHKLLALRELPTAIVCSNDLAALGVMRAAKARKIRCPQALSVVGFDDLEISAHLEVPLTTVRQPINEIGQMAVHSLIDRIVHRDKGVGTPYVLPPELIVRASTGPVPKNS